MSLYRRKGLGKEFTSKSPSGVGGVPLGTTEMEKKFSEEH